MKKVNFNPLNSERIDNLRKEYLNQTLAHPVCKKFIDKYEITEDEINRNTSKFIKVIEDHKICANCPGLNNCPKALKGIHFELDLDEDTDDIILIYSPCDDEFQHLAIEAKYIIRDFSDSYLEYNARDFIQNKDYLDVRKNVIKHMTSCFTSEGIYLHGNRMTGKTFMLAVYSKEYINKGYGTVAFVDAPSEIKHLNDLNFTSKESFLKRLNKLMDVDLLVLDDFGNEYKNEFIRDTIVYPLLDYRLKNNKLTWFTSSYNLDEISQMYSLKERYSPKANQLVSVIKGLAKEVYLGGTKFRK
jgi:primosomal protein DnaI